MYVSGVTVNCGKMPRESGFGNARLQSVLGLNNKGPGQAFVYAFQITFQLNGIASADVKVRRRSWHRVHYPAPFHPLAKVMSAYDSRMLRDLEPARTEDAPAEGNVKRADKHVVVQDDPGPLFGVENPKMYPLVYEGKFVLVAQNKLGTEMASVNYYVRLRKQRYNAPAEGEFEVLRTHVVPPPPPVPAPCRTLVTTWLRNWSFCRKYNCSDRGKVSTAMGRFTMHHWLMHYKTDSMKMSLMRHLLASEGAGPEVAHFPDDVVIDKVTELLLGGRIHIHEGLATASAIADGLAETTIFTQADFGNDPPFPLAERKARQQAESDFEPPPLLPIVPELPTFSSPANFDRQAATLVAASRCGMAFAGL